MRLPGEDFISRRAAQLRAAARDLGRPGLAEEADALERAYQGWLDEALTSAEAAEERGWAEDTVRSYLRDGRLPQAGKKNTPRVQRRDLYLDPHEAPTDAAPDVPMGDPALRAGLRMVRPPRGDRPANPLDHSQHTQKLNRAGR